MSNFAVVQNNDQIFYSQYACTEHEPHSATTQLIQGIWQNYPEQALVILRNRILTTEEITPLVQGMVKIAAKRISQTSQDEIAKNLSAKNKIEVQFTPTPRKENPHQHDRPVSAVLVDQNEKILARASNSNAQNRTLHAEVNLVQSWWREYMKPIPSQSRLIVTLEPCKMCVGMIASTLENTEDFCVEFLEHDRGPATRQNWLKTRQITRGAEGLFLA